MTMAKAETGGAAKNVLMAANMIDQYSYYL
jgi:hypothetical protein